MGFLFLVPFLIGLLVLIVNPYKMKNRYWRWMWILLPPSLLVFLIWIPQDWFTSGIWLTAIISTFISVCSILVNVVVAIDRKVERGEPISRRLAVRLVRPVLVVCLFFFADNMVDLSMKSADIYAVELARQMQRICNANGICPESVKEWPYEYSESDIGQFYYGKYGTTYPIRYDVSEDGKEFEIMVFHNMDEDFYVTGGVNKELRAKTDGDGGIREIDINELSPN
ncbi:MAG: hypothetical protein ACYS8Z_10040 [Planctomycetota bacterium]|jgi:hypothetical protein